MRCEMDCCCLCMYDEISIVSRLVFGIMNQQHLAIWPNQSTDLLICLWDAIHSIFIRDFHQLPPVQQVCIFYLFCFFFNNST